MLNLQRPPRKALIGFLRGAQGSALPTPASTPAPGLTDPEPANPAGPVVLNENNAAVITLTRVTYKLKAAAAGQQLRSSKKT